MELVLPGTVHPVRRVTGQNLLPNRHLQRPLEYRIVPLCGGSVAALSENPVDELLDMGRAKLRHGDAQRLKVGQNPAVQHLLIAGAGRPGQIGTGRLIPPPQIVCHRLLFRTEGLCRRCAGFFLSSGC